MKIGRPSKVIEDPPLASRGVTLLAGMCFFCVALCFHYVDRAYGDFRPGLALAWALATVLGFGIGAWQRGEPTVPARTVCVILGLLGLLLFFPALQLYGLLRGMALCMLFVAVARAPLMRTRKDFSFSLTLCFVVACAAATSPAADWTLWVYLGPAWIFAALALAVDHVSRSPGVPRWLVGSSSLAFIGLTAVIAAVLFLVLPRPPQLGFGFMPPGVVAPPPAPEAPGTGASPATGEPGGGGSAGAASPRDAPGRWSQMLAAMRGSIQDPHMPDWQRRGLGALLDALGALAGAGSGGGGQGDGQPQPAVQVRIPLRSLLLIWLALVVAVALAWLAWRVRHLLAFHAFGTAAWLATYPSPRLSMRLSAAGLGLGLRRIGRQAPAAWTLRERLAAAEPMPLLARRWLGEAVSIYYDARFGAQPANAAAARRMRLAVAGGVDFALDSLRGQVVTNPSRSIV